MCTVLAMPRSTFGTQTRSAWSNAPAYGFARSSRSTADKVWVSRKHNCPAMRGTQSADAFYVAHELHPSGKGISFGKAARPSSVTSAEALNDPAPNAYVHAGSLEPRGKVLSHTRSEPIVHFAKTSREKAKRLWAGDLEHQRRDLIGGDSPAPTKYHPKSQLGSTPAARFTRRPLPPKPIHTSPGHIYTLPSTRDMRFIPSLSVASRDQRAKLYIAEGKVTEKAAYGRASPGPAVDYHHLDGSGCFGKQVSSVYATRPRSAFARASRWGERERALAKNFTPGPGSYDNV